MTEVLPKNIIFMVSDGMSVSMASAYREYLNPRVDGYHPTCIFNSYLLGQQSTYSQDDVESITDSGASSTAMACGVKTKNAYVGLDSQQNPVASALELAKEAGKKTGICVTAEVCHATPAGFLAHVEDRMHFDRITDQYLDDRIQGDIKFDLLLGGGRKYFMRPDRNLVEEFQAKGYEVAFTFKDFQMSSQEQLVGLFAEEGLPYALDRDYRTLPSLAQMTEAAIHKLKQNADRGFFLMVEGSQIDWGAHKKDAVAVMSEIDEFAKALSVAIDFAKQDGQTLVLSTSDHATGGMTMGSGDIASWRPEFIQDVRFTPDFLAKDIVLRRDIEDTFAALVDFKITEHEYLEIYTALHDYHKSKKEIQETISQLICQIVNRRSNTGWTSFNHTGEDVNVYGYGPGSHLWRGWRDNTETGKLLKGLAIGEVDAFF